MQDTIYISGLEPLIAPEKVASWPLAPGWYVISGLLLLVLAYLAWLWIRNRRKNRYRLHALDQLKAIIELAGEHPGQGEILALNRLLKITALTVYPREWVASLTGREWLNFLVMTSPGTEIKTPLESLITESTLKHPDQMKVLPEEWNILTDFCKHWIRHHKYIAESNQPGNPA